MLPKLLVFIALSLLIMTGSSHAADCHYIGKWATSVAYNSEKKIFVQIKGLNQILESDICE
ncbi:2725_t:CDS:2 [Gigaspora margarita]|uniref:2725_t:CDS:1 n=1 Tax=Gigaspora margarita TaxID=4874 RepID=A0ABM8W202_GIGMA|nr:2725_t:CDS:2 [Gigaspora margarita]